ncbi:MAG TPA: PAS domain-containing protein, partial [Polyangiales bacterium]|nr:PAS domain-containing protein [Polyangiales bacterium]
RAGATELVLHTPDLVALIDTLRRALAQPMAAPRIGPERRVEVEHEHERRIVRQLERQVLLNAGLSRRCSALAAELRVLAGISENVLKHRDLDPALDEALIACLDACGIARGVLYLLSGDDRIKVRAVGAETTWTHEQLRDFFGHERTLRELIAAGGSAFLSIDADPTREQQQLLAACAVSSMLIVPLIYLDRPFGALMLAEPSQSQDADDLIAFAEGLAAQITQVLALAAAFAEESRARDRAEQQAALCSALLLHAPDCVAHLDPHGTILFVNHVMRESLPEMQVGREWLSAQALEFRERAGQAFELVISTGEPTSFETTTTTDAADGGGGIAPIPRWYSHRLGPVRREGQIVGVMLVARDISEKKLAEAQLLVSDRMASVGMLAASVAHEINNPLAAMMINLELMERDLGHRLPDGERLHKELEGAREGGRRVTQVVRDLKIFSRSSETLTRVKLRDVLECSIRMANNEIRHRAKLVVEFADVPTVDADESRLGQVFLNLILNAAQAMPEGNAEKNELRIAIAVDSGGRVVVTISDTGCGIPEGDQAQLFRP